jgi:hypothetical protein
VRAASSGRPAPLACQRRASAKWGSRCPAAAVRARRRPLAARRLGQALAVQHAGQPVGHPPLPAFGREGAGEPQRGVVVAAAPRLEAGDQPLVRGGRPGAGSGHGGSLEVRNLGRGPLREPALAVVAGRDHQAAEYPQGQLRMVVGDAPGGVGQRDESIAVAGRVAARP